MLALLLTLILFPQEQKIVTCEVIEPDQSVACPEGGKMVLFKFDDPKEAKAIFDEWRLAAPLRESGRVNADAPLGSREIRAGDKVKAIITDTKFIQVAECNVRVWRNIKSWRQFRQGETPPNVLYWLPEDCQPGYGRN